MSVRLDGVCDHPAEALWALARGARARMGVAGGEEVFEGELAVVEARVLRLRGEGSGGGVGAGES